MHQLGSLDDEWFLPEEVEFVGSPDQSCGTSNGCGDALGRGSGQDGLFCEINSCGHGKGHLSTCGDVSGRGGSRVIAERKGEFYGL